ncbi:E3 ubiquitin-protein ligase CHIP-like isoform X2 [Phalaenopsis equestris]|nr:E3 ubiquitin-protein ligase CHIP-like isoform X2 [Phalaenopsis equestris]
MVHDIWEALARAKYMEWELSSSERAWRLQKLKVECEKALMLHQFLQDPQPEDCFQASPDDKVDQFELLNEVFSKALEDDTPREVPDYLCCNITLDIFQDPVITPSGVTYEKAVLLEHLEKVGKFDPITREPLDKDKLIPNLAIKGAARAFLKKHGWAYKTSQGS